MRLRELRVMSVACVYGNPQLDAVKGFSGITKACGGVSDMVFYFGNEKKAADRATMDYTNPNTQVMLLRELRKNISTKMAVNEMETSFGKLKKEQNILGGSPAKDTEVKG